MSTANYDRATLSVSSTLPCPLSPPEELANRLTHGLGLILAVIGGAVLLRAAILYGDAKTIAGVGVYAATLVAMYAASTLSHSFDCNPDLRHKFRTLDQVCIFLLIAGTFTPLALRYMQGGWWWALFIAVWALAAAGIIAKLFFTRLHNVAVSAYVLLGWLPILMVKPIIEIMPREALLWVLSGGVLYTLGTIFLMRDDRVPYFHAIWHVFVIAASACHFYAVMAFVVPWP